jgi:prepilin-type N-terminal cleavage/methylation domain-containing protein
MYRTKQMQGGFTLVEMIVAVALFAIVMVVAVGALLALTGANKKAQAIQSVMNNLNITLDSMVRNIRMGTQYHCGVGSYNGASDSCPSGDYSFTFTCNPGTAVCGGSGVRWAYRLSCPGSISGNSCSSGGSIQRSTDGGGSWSTLTSPDISVQTLTFYVLGTNTGTSGDFNAPMVIMVVTGQAGGASIKTQTTFHIQATAVQRELDI